MGKKTSKPTAIGASTLAAPRIYHNNVTQDTPSTPVKHTVKKLCNCILLCALAFALLSCGSTQDATEEDVYEGVSYTSTKANSYDEAIVMAVDEEAKTIQLYNFTAAKTYTLSYTSGTGMKNVFGDEIVAGQLAEGDMVKVAFVKETKVLKNLWVSDEVTVFDDITNFSINSAAQTMTIDGALYNLYESLVIVQNGVRLETNEINSVDTLKIIVKDRDVYGIAITTGHGYVRLEGADDFVGGWISIGSSIVKKITQDMLITVPEGSYSVYLSHKGLVASEDIVVEAGKEVTIDLSTMELEDTSTFGTIYFVISPSGATLYIDGVETDYSSGVTLSTGIHQITVKASGYTTVTQYIKVGTSSASMTIELEEGDDDEDEDDTTSDEDEDDTVSSNTITATTDYQVYIDAPEGAEVYLDGSYIGIVPCSFDKSAGTYELSLRKSGYTTKSYTLQIDSSEKDISYSFSDLVESD